MNGLRFSDLWRMPWSTFIGVLLGVTLDFVTPSVVGPLSDIYDSAYPVLRMKGTVEAREADAVVLHTSGEKMRGDECRLLAVYGYAVHADGRLSDATATRIDQPQNWRPRGQGHYDIGLWRVRPVEPAAVGVRVISQHDCVGRVVLSVIADVSLKEAKQ